MTDVEEKTSPLSKDFWTPVKALSGDGLSKHLLRLVTCDELTNTMKSLFPPSSQAGSHRFVAIGECNDIAARPLVQVDREARPQQQESGGWWVRASAHVIDPHVEDTTHLVHSTTSTLLCANLVLCAQSSFSRCRALRDLGSRPIGNTLLFGVDATGVMPKATLLNRGVEARACRVTEQNCDEQVQTPQWYARLFMEVVGLLGTEYAPFADALANELNGPSVVVCRRAQYELNPMVSPLDPCIGFGENVAEKPASFSRGAVVEVVELILSSTLE